MNIIFQRPVTGVNQTSPMDTELLYKCVCNGSSWKSGCFSAKVYICNYSIDSYKMLKLFINFDFFCQDDIIVNNLFFHLAKIIKLNHVYDTLPSGFEMGSLGLSKTMKIKEMSSHSLKVSTKGQLSKVHKEGQPQTMSGGLHGRKKAQIRGQSWGSHWAQLDRNQTGAAFTERALAVHMWIPCRFLAEDQAE